MVIGLLVVVIVLQLAVYGCVAPRRRGKVDVTRGYPPVPGAFPSAPPPPPPPPSLLEATEHAAMTLLRSAAEELRAAGSALQEAAAHLKDEPGKGYRASRAHVAAKRANAAAEGLRR
jgi:hypothetical protein